MKIIRLAATVLIATSAVMSVVAGPAAASDPTPQELLETVGIPPSDGQRGQMLPKLYFY